MMTYFDKLRRNTLLFRKLDRILGILGEAGIKMVVLKNAALANSVYEDIGLRWMTDLDLLLPAERLYGALEIASGIGYPDPYPDVTLGLKAMLPYNVHLLREDKGHYI